MTTPELQLANKIVARAEEFVLNTGLPGLTGILKSILGGGGDIVQGFSNAIQRSRSQNFLLVLMDEFQIFIENGKVDHKYLQEEEGQMCLQELMEYLDKEPPDKRKFMTLKSIFLKAASADPSEWKNQRPRQYMVVCRKLSSDEIALLSTAYQYSRKMKISGPTAAKEVAGADQWPKFLAQESTGALTPGLVDHFEESLIRHRLIGDRDHSDRSGIQHSREFRLSPLGLELCEFLDSCVDLANK